MARVLSEEASSAEQESLYNQLQRDEQLQQQFDLLARIWKENNTSFDEDAGQVQVNVSKILNRASGENIPAVFLKNPRRRRRYRIAASFLLVLTIVSVAFYFKNSFVANKKGGDQEPLITQKGSRFRTLLADGTTVWLNAGSKLYYETDFNGATREVRLEGEAFFDVAPSISPEGGVKRPFIVHTSGIDIRVLGTAFNVKSYPEDKNVETTLYRGAVQVLRPESPSANVIELKPNQKLIIPKQAVIRQSALPELEKPAVNSSNASDFVIKPVDSTKKESERIETAWVYSRLEFRGSNFEEVARQMERWYNVKIVFTDEMAKKLQVNGTFENETVGEAFAALKEAFPINYKIDHDEISVNSSQ